MEQQQNQPEKKPDDKIVDLAEYLKQKIQQRFADLKKEKEESSKKANNEEVEPSDSPKKTIDELIFES